MSPIDAMGCESKIGFQLIPPFVVFQTPPEAEPTYTTFGLPGTPSTSATRPLMLTGPILRHSRPFQIAVSESVALASAIGRWAGGAACAARYDVQGVRRSEV